MTDLPPPLPPAMVPAPTARELDDLAELERQRKLGRTAQQLTTGAAAVILLNYVARLAGVDLDPYPGDGVDLPSSVGAALLVAVGQLAAWRMNRRKAPTA